MSDCFVNPWTVASQAPLPMGFPRQECWSGLPFPSPGDLLDPEIELTFPALAGRFFTTEPFFSHWATWEAHNSNTEYFKEIILKIQKWIGEEMLQHQSFISSILFLSDFFFLISLGAHILDYQELVIKNNYFRKLDLHGNLCFQKLIMNNDFLKNLSFFSKENVQRSF